MTEVNDGYDTYYAERLWLLLPGIYRAADTDSSGAPGPLRELVNRIGAQVAVVRRGMDRLWADQSIETCDDWVIPYLGDLLGTELIGNLDARAQRLDVAKTIHYRRRKGTVGILTELAQDVTGWTAVVVEGFRRLGRTRHGLDPVVAAGQGALTGGQAGGFAGLRSAHGALLAGTAFDESFRTADFRAGGRAGIEKLLVFLWRLTSFSVVAGTPVAVAGCPGQYVFDPTGRQVPLFLPAAAAAEWPAAAAAESHVPGPLTSSLEAALAGAGPYPRARPPYPDAGVPPRYGLGGGWQLTSLWPEAGRFTAVPGQSPPGRLTVDYHYGFPSMIGAGPFDRDLLPDRPAAVGPETVVTGGTGLDAALAAAGATGTVTVADSLSYAALGPAGSAADPVVSLLVRAGPGTRPVLRPVPGPGPGNSPDGRAEWVFTGGGAARLVLDGLTVSGCDIVLRGSFDTVRITACTVDPGTGAPGSPPLATAADGALLAPCRIFVEAGLGQLLVDHCVLGPVRTRSGGAVETLAITDSIVQGLPATSGAAFTPADVFDPPLLARGLAAGRPGRHGAGGLPADPLPAALLARMPQADAAALLAFAAGSPPGQHGDDVPLGGLNALVGAPSSLYDPVLFATVSLSARTRALAAQAQAGTLEAVRLPALNRALLEESFPVALGVAALAVADAAVQLTRVTVLGRIAAHRLMATDSILGDFTAVDDVQEGCVRFSAYASGSVLPRQYRAAAIPPGAPIFTSGDYGQAGYAQLIETADAAITGGADGASISSGAGNGSEMGAYCADLNPVKEQGLLAKYAEYMPLGLTPVIIHVT